MSCSLEGLRTTVGVSLFCARVSLLMAQEAGGGSADASSLPAPTAALAQMPAESAAMVLAMTLFLLLCAVAAIARGLCANGRGRAWSLADAVSEEAYIADPDAPAAPPGQTVPTKTVLPTSASRLIRCVRPRGDPGLFLDWSVVVCNVRDPGPAA
jgi:hypothetical protein